MEAKKIFFLIFIIFLNIIGPMSVLVAHAYSSGSAIESYTVIADKGDAALFLISKNYSIVMMPLDKILDHNCKGILSKINDSNIDYYFNEFFITGGSVNLTLPNGTHVKNININFYRYLGCFINKSEIFKIDYKYYRGTVDVNVYILVPPPSNRHIYSLPAILYAKNVVFVYKRVNATHFTINISLYNAKYNDIFFSTTRKFNLSIKFLIDKRTWNAEYWNGHKWINAGVLPIGAPDLDVTTLLYQYYLSYSRSVDYYLTHRDQLNEIVSKLRTLLSNNENEKALKLLNKIVYSPKPSIWENHTFFYLGLNYTLSPIIGSAESQIIHYTIPKYNWIFAHLSPRAVSLKKALIKAAIDYIINGNISKLEELIVSNNGFVVYDVRHHSGANTSITPILKYGVLPSTSTIFDLKLPVDGISGLPKELANITYLAVLDLSPYFTPNLSNVKVEYNVTSPLSITNESYILASVVDNRLASEWMISLMSTLPGPRTNILNNLNNIVTNDYRNTWYRIINGENATTALLEFKEHLKSAVLAAALQLGGRRGKQLIETFMSHINQTTTTSPPPPSQTTRSLFPPEHNSVGSTSTQHSTKSIKSRRSHYIIAGAVSVIIIVGAIVLAHLWRRGAG